MAANNFFGYPAPHGAPTYSATPNPVAPGGYAPGPAAVAVPAAPAGVPPAAAPPTAVAYNAATAVTSYRAAPAVVAYSAYQPPHQNTVSYAAAPAASVPAPPVVTAAYPGNTNYGQYQAAAAQPVYDPTKQATATYNPYTSNVTVSYSVSDAHYQARPVYSNNSTVNVVAGPAVITAPRSSYTTYGPSSSTSSFTYGAPAPMNPACAVGPKANMYPPNMGMPPQPQAMAKVPNPHWVRPGQPPPHLHVGQPRMVGHQPPNNPRMFKQRVTPKPQQLHYCEVCKISCAGPQTYKEHLEGQKHKKKEAALKSGASGPSTRSGSALRCELCDVTCTGSDAYAAHIRGSKHQKVVKLHTKLGKPIPSVDPILITKTTAETEAAPVPNAPAQPVQVTTPLVKSVTVPKITFVGPNQAETVAKSQPSNTPQNEVTIPRLPDEKDVQPVGHDYIEEIKSEDGKITSFNCKLCDCKFNDPNAKEMHMKGRRHRLQYKKKVNPDLVVDLKPSLRQRKMAEERAKRSAAREEFWKRREEEFKMLEEEERAFWEERRRFEDIRYPRLGPPMFGFPPMMRRPDSIEDRHVNAKHNEIYPEGDELGVVQRMVSTAEKALKIVSDKLYDEAVEAGKVKGEHVDEDEDDQTTRRVLKGVMRVGILAKGLILKGDEEVGLVVLCGQRPTKRLLEKIGNLLPTLLAKNGSQEDEFVVEQKPEQASLVVTVSKRPVVLTITLTSPLVREEAAAENGTLEDVSLNQEICLEALAELRRAKWFQARAAQLHSSVILIRVLRHLFKSSKAFKAMNQFTLELLVEKCLASVGMPLSPGDGLRRVFEALASGILLSNNPGFLDPCEREPQDTAADLSAQQREDITAAAQASLRLIAFRQVHKVLKMNPLPPPKFGNRPFSRKRRLDEGQVEPTAIDDSGKKDKKTEGQDAAPKVDAAPIAPAKESEVEKKNKFGQKLMEKMGWEKGTGLGAQAQGNVDIITLKHKDDSKGVGYKGHEDTWIAHQDEFSSVLAQLNAAHTDESEEKKEVQLEEEFVPKSLEHTSKKRKKRVHYHKFTRGKDLSRYSATDLDCILGSQAVVTKRKSEKVEEKEAEDKEEEEEVDMNGDCPMVGFKQNGAEAEKGEEKQAIKEKGLLIIQGGSIHDYFAKKMAALKAKQSNGEVTEEKVMVEVTHEIKTNESPTNGFKEEEEEVMTEVIEVKQKKKKMKSKAVDENEVVEITSEPKRKKGKKSKTAEEELVANMTEEVGREKAVIQTDEEIVEVTQEIKKKKISKAVDENKVVEITSEPKRKKGKKSKAAEEELVANMTEEVVHEKAAIQTDEEIVEVMQEIKKRKKSTKDDDVEIMTEVAQEVRTKKNKKSKPVQVKPKQTNEVVESASKNAKISKAKVNQDVLEDIEIEETITITEASSKKKSKRKADQEPVQDAKRSKKAGKKPKQAGKKPVPKVVKASQKSKKAKKSKPKDPQLDETDDRVEDLFLKSVQKAFDGSSLPKIRGYAQG
eukprot:maker-scaffold217_size252476-snap-gene-0.14 protein:Tk00452 transcript:maker-scaffold217_size252476-snap-gene-0.14-mRNA-1 annotation:"zinc finger rna-binding protein"